MTDPGEGIAANQAFIEYLLQMIWVEQFSLQPEPVAAAKVYAEGQQKVAVDADSDASEEFRRIFQEKLNDFFDVVVARLEERQQ